AGWRPAVIQWSLRNRRARQHQCCDFSHTLSFSRPSAPMAFDPVPAPTMLGPVAGHPGFVVPPGDLVMPRPPDIRAAVPAVIAGEPDMTRGRRGGGCLDHRRGGGDGDVDSGARGGGGAVKKPHREWRRNRNG